MIKSSLINLHILIHINCQILWSHNSWVYQQCCHVDWDYKLHKLDHWQVKFGFKQISGHIKYVGLNYIKIWAMPNPIFYCLTINILIRKNKVTQRQNKDFNKLITKWKGGL